MARRVCTSVFVLACLLAAVAAVPEPATLAFVGFGMYGLASRLRHSQRRPAA